MFKARLNPLLTSTASSSTGLTTSTRPNSIIPNVSSEARQNFERPNPRRAHLKETGYTDDYFADEGRKKLAVATNHDDLGAMGDSDDNEASDIGNESNDGSDDDHGDDDHYGNNYSQYDESSDERDSNTDGITIHSNIDNTDNNPSMPTLIQGRVYKAEEFSAFLSKGLLTDKLWTIIRRSEIPALFEFAHSAFNLEPKDFGIATDLPIKTALRDVHVCRSFENVTCERFLSTVFRKVLNRRATHRTEEVSLNRRDFIVQAHQKFPDLNLTAIKRDCFKIMDVLDIKSHRASLSKEVSIICGLVLEAMNPYLMRSVDGKLAKTLFKNHFNQFKSNEKKKLETMLRKQDRPDYVKVIRRKYDHDKTQADIAKLQADFLTIQVNVAKIMALLEKRTSESLGNLEVASPHGSSNGGLADHNVNSVLTPTNPTVASSSTPSAPLIAASSASIPQSLMHKVSETFPKKPTRAGHRVKNNAPRVNKPKKRRKDDENNDDDDDDEE